jgi:hypothetical protein
MSANREFTPKRPGRIRPANPADIQIIPHGRDIHMFQVTESEMSDFEAGYASVDFGLLALCFGVLSTLVVALVTVRLSVMMLAAFVAVASVSFLGTLFFGLRTWKERQRVKLRIAEIKGRRTQSPARIALPFALHHLLILRQHDQGSPLGLSVRCHTQRSIQ